LICVPAHFVLRVMALEKETMAVVWLSADKRAAADMAFLYIRTSLLKRWWKSCELILWGPAVEAAAADPDIRYELALLKHLGAEITACEACAVRYGVCDRLCALGIEVKGMSEHLTELLKSDTPLLLI